MVALPGVLVRYGSWGNVWDCPKRSKRDHLFRDMFGELLDLLSDVAQEGVAGPSAYEHDGVHRYAGEVHFHRGAGPKRVSSDFVRFEAKAGAANCCAAGSKSILYLF